MINAGAIAVSSLLDDIGAPSASSACSRRVRRFAGHPLDDRRGGLPLGARRPAIATARSRHLLRNFDVVARPGRGRRSTSTSSQCSILVDCRDLAVMAATLANRGVNPITGASAPCAAEYVEDVLSVMTTCGMYDYAGEWLYRRRRAGQERRLAAASSRCCPGRLGIGVFSPRARCAGQQRARHRGVPGAVRASSGCTCSTPSAPGDRSFGAR